MVNLYDSTLLPMKSRVHHSQVLFHFYLLQSKGDSPSQHGLQAQNVFDEDLQKKIEENERLHIQVSSAVVSVSPCVCQATGEVMYVMILLHCVLIYCTCNLG